MMPHPGTLDCARMARRGQPVIALAIIISIWIAVRISVVAFEGDPPPDALQLAGQVNPPPISLPKRQPMVSPAPYRQTSRIATSAVPHAPHSSGGVRGHSPSRLIGGSLRLDEGHDAGFSGATPAAMLVFAEEMAAAYEGWERPHAPPETRRQKTRRMSFLASTPRTGDDIGGDPPHPAEHPRSARWSADGWLLLRGGDQLPALAAGTAAYGGSQAGAVLRYALAPASALRPQVYARVSGALGGRVQQSELALGLKVRPVKRLPIAILGEWRLQEQPGETRTRPVFMAITELPPLRMPLGVEAEAYAQGGWAGGRGATPFYDLAATLQRKMVRPLAGIQFSAGGGVWSGGQRGASRLDVGPRVELRSMLGPPTRRIGVRVGVDWRFRVAGKAEPGSGPALTVAAGF